MVEEINKDIKPATKKKLRALQKVWIEEIATKTHSDDSGLDPKEDGDTTSSTDKKTILEIEIAKLKIDLEMKIEEEMAKLCDEVKGYLGGELSKLRKELKKGKFKT